LRCLSTRDQFPKRARLALDKQATRYTSVCAGSLVEQPVHHEPSRECIEPARQDSCSGSALDSRGLGTLGPQPGGNLPVRQAGPRPTPTEHDALTSPLRSLAAYAIMLASDCILPDASQHAHERGNSGMEGAPVLSTLPSTSARRLVLMRRACYLFRLAMSEAVLPHPQSPDPGQGQRPFSPGDGLGGLGRPQRAPRE
jgi:hypothetical protein